MNVPGKAFATVPVLRAGAMLLALLAAGRPAAAGTILVPQDHATIQAAIAASVNGDIIQIKSGTYPEAVSLVGKSSVVLVGKGKVVIDPPPGTIGVTVDSCTSCTLENIQVLRGAPNCIYGIDTAGCLIFKCKVQNSTGDGIRLDNCTGFIIQSCRVTNAGNDAISLGVGTANACSSNLLIGNKLVTPVDDGIDINGSGNLVEGNTAIRPLEDGFEIDDFTVGSGNVFRENKAVKPFFSGFVVTGEGNTFQDNKVVKSGDDAVFVGAGSLDNVIQRTAISKAGADGIFGATGADGLVLTDNTVSKAADDGIDVQGDGAAVDGNSVKTCGDNGFEIQGDTGTYTGNKAKASKDDGFDLAGTGNLLSTNWARGSKGFDLFDQSAGASTADGTNDFKTVFP